MKLLFATLLITASPIDAQPFQGATFPESVAQNSAFGLIPTTSHTSLPQYDVHQYGQYGVPQYEYGGASDSATLSAPYPSPLPPLTQGGFSTTGIGESYGVMSSLSTFPSQLPPQMQGTFLPMGMGGGYSMTPPLSPFAGTGGGMVDPYLQVASLPLPAPYPSPFMGGGGNLSPSVGSIADPYLPSPYPIPPPPAMQGGFPLMQNGLGGYPTPMMGVGGGYSMTPPLSPFAGTGGGMVDPYLQVASLPLPAPYPSPFMGGGGNLSPSVGSIADPYLPSPYPIPPPPAMQGGFPLMQNGLGGYSTPMMGVGGGGYPTPIVYPYAASTPFSNSFMQNGVFPSPIELSFTQLTGTAGATYNPDNIMLARP